MPGRITTVQPRRERIVLSALTALSVSLLGSGQPQRPGLTFDQRVEAQWAIERVYYSHQVGPTKPFEQAVPRALLEKKVRTYLKQSVALAEFWKTPVTAEALQRELERIAGETRLPERLLEIYAALGNDPYLILECFARPSLVDRLSRSFFAIDQRIHAEVRAAAESLHHEFTPETIDAVADRKIVQVIDLVEVSSESGRLTLDPPELVDPGTSRYRLELDQEAFEEWRGQLSHVAEEPGVLREEREAFTADLVLEEVPNRIRFARLAVQKEDWESWWARIAPGIEESRFAAAAPVDWGWAVPLPQRLETAAWSTTLGSQAACAADDVWTALPFTAPPVGRRGHTAVWTGSHMLIWGGVGTSALNSGARYDPLTDTWTAISTTSAPSARVGHFGLWTGAVMLIWGGSGPTNTGGRYDPSSNTWMPMTTVNAPVPGNGYEVVWTGEVMWVWGAGQAAGAYYDPSNDQWAFTTSVNAPAGRVDHTLVWTGTEIIVWGGLSAGLYQNSGARYDPSTDTWSPTSLVLAPSHRARHSAVWTGSAMVVWGGQDLTTTFNSGGRYDPQLNEWTLMSSNTQARHGALTLWTGIEMVVLMGYSHAPAPGGARYNPVTDSWTPVSTMNAPDWREEASAVWTGNEVILWGGSGLNSGGRYNTMTDSWVPTGTYVLERRERHTAVWTGSAMIVWGGYDSFIPPVAGARYDPLLAAWRPISTLGAPIPHVEHTAVWTGTEMIVWGGWEFAVITNTGARYDPVADSWTPTSTTGAPEPRGRHTAIWTGSEMIVWGGQGSTPLDTGGRYDPATDTWLPVSLVGAPAPRERHTAIWTGNVMALWGGRAGAIYLGGGGRYDPSADLWFPISPEAPSPRSNHSAVWTGRWMIIWGGGDGVNYLSTGGRYDPVADVWGTFSINGAPVGRVSHAAVWTGRLMVVWGGYNGSMLSTGGLYHPLTNEWVPSSSVGAPLERTDHTAVWSGSSMIVWGGRRGCCQTLGSGADYVPEVSPDADGDTLTACRGDCDDADPLVYPGAPQVCDGANNDCADPAWPALNGTNEFDDDQDEYAECEGDCDDSEASINPGAIEVCDGRDNDCHSGVDDGFDSDADGHVPCTGDCDDSEPSVHPGAPQFCGDGLNNDCTHQAWPALSGTNEVDDDGDLLSECQGDCDDGRSTVFPGAPEICDGVNNDCADPSWPSRSTGDSDMDLDGVIVCQGDCDDAASTVFPGAPEVCNDGLSNDCNHVNWPMLPPADIDSDMDGLRPCQGDCDDSRASVRPGGAQVCDGLNNNCDQFAWPALTGTNEADNDGDSYSGCQSDCDDTRAATYPMAPEANDGRDNQCAGDPGYGLVDEISGELGFASLTDPTLCWPAQAGATAYTVARASDARFASGCQLSVTNEPCWNDPEVPSLGQSFDYLVRAYTPSTGSWGRDSAGVERVGICSTSPQVFSFVDTTADDVSATALQEFFETLGVSPSDYIFFEIRGGSPSDGAICAERANAYRDAYLAFAQTGGAIISEGWNKWHRSETGPWSSALSFGWFNLFGPDCFEEFAWCPEDGLGGRSLASRPAAAGSCEAYDNLHGCGNGSWTLTIKVAADRLAACGF